MKRKYKATLAERVLARELDRADAEIKVLKAGAEVDRLVILELTSQVVQLTAQLTDLCHLAPVSEQGEDK